MKEKKFTEKALYSAILMATLIALLMLVISLPVYESKKDDRIESAAKKTDNFKTYLTVR